MQLIVLREREEKWGIFAIWIIEIIDILEIIIKIAPLEIFINTSNQMKKLLLILFLLCFGLSLQAETNLVVWKKDGSKVAFALSEEPKVTFSENSLMINTTTVSVSYDLEDMAKFTYEDPESQGIRNIENDKDSSFKFDGEMLLFLSLKAGSKVAIHNLGGVLVFSRTIEVAGDYSFPISHLDKGVYVVSVDGLTYKIVKR